jgi:hypothetical protein
MKKSLVMFLLVSVALCAAQQAAPGAAQTGAPQAGAPQTAAPQQQASAPAQKKEIKNPAEYNAYIAAVQTQDPNAKAVAIESFLQTYPNSVMKEDATELLMKTYQQGGNAQKMIETGKKLLQMNPKNLTALALLAYMNRMQAQQGGPQAQQMLAEAGQYAQQGLQALPTATKPEGYQDADWAKMKESFTTIFHSALGNSALAAKDYAAAQQNLLAAVQASPNNFLDVYQLALSYLEPKPPVVDGLFWIARAVALAQKDAPQAVATIQKYGASKYARYHGTDQGWTELLQTAQNSPTMPQGFTVAPAPSPADQAAEMVKEQPVAKMGFGTWVFILTSGNQQAAQEVWDGIKGKSLQMVGNVISATPTKLMLAATEDAIQANTPEVELTMTAPIPAKLMPKVGSQITFEGTPDSYDAQPFLIHMVKGTLVVRPGAAAAKPAAAKKAPVRKKK